MDRFAFAHDDTDRLQALYRRVKHHGFDVAERPYRRSRRSPDRFPATWSNTIVQSRGRVDPWPAWMQHAWELAFLCRAPGCSRSAGATSIWTAKEARYEARRFIYLL